MEANLVVSKHKQEYKIFSTFIFFYVAGLNMLYSFFSRLSDEYFIFISRLYTICISSRHQVPCIAQIWF